MPKDAFNGLGICVRAKLQQIVEINKLICAHNSPFLDWNYQCRPFTTLYSVMSSIHIPKCPDKKMPTFVKTKRAFLAPSQKKHIITFRNFHSKLLGGGRMTTYL